MEEYLTPLSSYLRSRKVDQLTIKDIIHQLTVYCKDCVYDNTMPLAINRINAAEHFDSIIQSCDFIEVNEDYDIDKVFDLVTYGLRKSVFIFYSICQEDELERNGTFLWKSNILDNQKRLGLFDIIVPNLSERISLAFRLCYPKKLDVSTEFIEKVQKQMNDWKVLGYLDSNYRTDLQKPTKFCCAIKTFLDTIDDVHLTGNQFKQFCQTLFYMRISDKHWKTVKTAWYAAYNPDIKA